MIFTIKKTQSIWDKTNFPVIKEIEITDPKLDYYDLWDLIIKSYPEWEVIKVRKGGE